MAEANPNPTAAPVKGHRPKITVVVDGARQMQGDMSVPTQMSGDQHSGGQMSASTDDRPLYADWAMI